MDKLIALILALFSIWLGYDILKIGVKAIRERDKGIGPMDPRMGVIGGPMLIAGGLIGIIFLFILPLFNGN